MKDKTEKHANYKNRIWEILDVGAGDDLLSKIFDFFLISLIFLNILAVVLESVDSLRESYGIYFFWFETFSVIIFSIEYVLRVWSSTSKQEFSRPIVGRLKFIFKPLPLIDLIAIIPFYLSFMVFDLRFIRTLRLFRLLRVLKLGRYAQSLGLLGKVFKSRKEELFISSLIMIVLVVLTSSFIYFAEHDAQPEAFPDIPSSMWWAIVTLTTVGYGDVYPITAIGKVFAAIIAVLGIGMFALPTGIIGASFIEEIEKKKSEAEAKKAVIICPHCNEKIDHEHLNEQKSG